MSSITDRWNDSNPHLELKQPMCHRCANYLKGTTACVAFPDGIPDPILAGDVLHDAPYPGDNGVQFEQEKT